MDLRTIVIVVAVVWLLLTHGKDLLALVASAIAKMWKLAPAPAKPEEAVVPEGVVSAVEARLAAFATIRPYLTATEAAEVWAKLEPGRPVPAAPVKAAPPASV